MTSDEWMLMHCGIIRCARWGLRERHVMHTELAEVLGTVR